MKKQGAYLGSSIANRNPFFLEYYNTWRRGQANARLHDPINRCSKDLRTNFGGTVVGCEKLIRHFAKDTIIPRYCMYTDGSQTLAMYAAAVPRAARSCTKFLCFLGERYRSGSCVDARPLYITLRQPTLRYITLRYVPLRYVTLRFVTLRYVSLRFVSLRFVTFRYKTLDIIPNLLDSCVASRKGLD